MASQERARALFAATNVASEKETQSAVLKASRAIWPPRGHAGALMVMRRGAAVSVSPSAAAASAGGGGSGGAPLRPVADEPV
jgi:hypothetical protein